MLEAVQIEEVFILSAFVNLPFDKIHAALLRQWDDATSSTLVSE
jgi:hypothetical protein